MPQRRPQNLYSFRPRLLSPALTAAFPHRFVILAFAVSTAARLFTAMMDRVDGRPGAPFSFVLRDATLLVSFFDVTRLAFFFVSVFVLVTSRHLLSSFIIASSVELASPVSRKSKPCAVKESEGQNRAGHGNRDRFGYFLDYHEDIATNSQRQRNHRAH